ncbi:hypothetical protein [Micromonospora zhanjiangensis]|uniref:Uncharacterized protein n=1 Tax=Micromonospora zhanjiangensis TaxID=1522057 RepID=A0ABV8KGF4_9ACTN
MTEQAGTAGEVGRIGRLGRVRLAIGFQYLLGVVYLIGGVGTLLIAAIRTGDWAGLLDPGLERFGDPKDVIAIGPDTVWNPILWIFGLSRVGAMLITPLAFAAVLLGLPCLADRAVRADRRTWRLLLIGTVICVVLAAVPSTPYGDQLQTWLLD